MNEPIKYPLYESSPTLMTPKVFGRERKYPWHELTMGMSFFVPKEQVKETTLRSLAYKSGKRLGRQFRVARHDTGYEVGRIK